MLFSRGNAKNVALDARNALKKARRIAAEGRWRSVLPLTRDEALWGAEPRLAELHLIAAREAGERESAAAQVARFVAASTLDPTIKFVLMRELLVTNDTASTWAILGADDRLLSHPLFLKTANRILAQTSSKTEKADVRAFLRRTFGRPEPARPSLLRFDVAATRPDLGPVRTPQFTWSADVSPDHQTRWAATEASFRHLLDIGRAPRLVEFSNVFIDPIGQIWTEDGRMVKSKGVATPTLSRSDVRTVPVAFNALGYTKGIFHWLTDRFVNTSFLLEPAAADVTVLLRATAPAFEAASLALAGIGADRVLMLSEPVFCERLVLARVGFAGLRWWGGAAPTVLAAAEAAAAAAEQDGFSAPRRLYISRRDATRRAIDGEDRLEAALESRGFTPLLFSKLPFAHQIAAAMAADVIVAPHGAGLSHILFAKPTARIVELLPVSPGTHHLRFNYAKLSILRNLDYRAFVEEPPVKAALWRPDIPALLKVVDGALH
ncbi:glycosyltransferase family 61 protein [Methylobrevis albus]|uniref:Glycosyltransferase family 61 protein n=1 Tax=Methylobrevis albus TaxID=2793297 RepID=A0A931I377_9HYPH|nr:glycosyltransferase family 61 protein [Methylobrevis albus]MBH0238445.1 glycosyltransferase family 61 protein [Methylobrevis albus]